MSDELVLCPSCGGRFNPVDGNRRRKYCFEGCMRRALDFKRYHGGTIDGLEIKAIRGSAAWKELNCPQVNLARLAERDAEYAKLGTRVTVEEHVQPSGRVVVVETRGQRCIGGWGV